MDQPLELLCCHAASQPLVSLLPTSGVAEQAGTPCETKSACRAAEPQPGAVLSIRVAQAHICIPCSPTLHACSLPHHHMLSTLSMQERMLRKAARLDPASYREQLERMEQLIASSAPADAPPQPDSPFRCRRHCSPATALLALCFCWSLQHAVWGWWLVSAACGKQKLATGQQQSPQAVCWCTGRQRPPPPGHPLKPAMSKPPLLPARRPRTRSRCLALTGRSTAPG